VNHIEKILALSVLLLSNKVLILFMRLIINANSTASAINSSKRKIAEFVVCPSTKIVYFCLHFVPKLACGLLTARIEESRSV
jgi:hypothetical protein